MYLRINNCVSFAKMKSALFGGGMPTIMIASKDNKY
jgi:hypothetical protein